MKAVSERKMERMSDGERGTLWAGRKVHLKEMCYSKKTNLVRLKASSAAERLGKKHQVIKVFFLFPSAFRDHHPPVPLSVLMHQL